MSGLIRRLIIFATADGLVLHAHGSSDQQRALLIDYGAKRISDQVRTPNLHGQPGARLEAFGLIGDCDSYGFIDIANLTYLIAITKRQEVAKIFGKPVYLVTDVAVLPLSSQQDAEQAIKALTDSSENISDDSDSDASDGVERTSNRASLEGSSTTPADDVRPQPSGRTSTTKVAEDVATRNVSFGRFASQWFSRQNRSTSTPPFPQPDTASNEPKPAESDDNIVEDVERAAQSKDQAKEEDRAPLAKVSNVNATATLSLLPRILKTIKMIFTSGSYFFSYDVDLTRRLQDLDSINQPLTFSKLNSVYFWNRALGARLLESNFSNYLTPILQGFVGQRAFVLQKPSASEPEKAKIKEVVEDANELTNTVENKQNQQSFLLTLISRRSTKRSGFRYLRRGIDDDGNVANFAETEQILSAADWNLDIPIRSFVQVRGSIPLYFSQSPYSFKPAVEFRNSAQVNQKAYNKHFQMLKNKYGAIQIAVLVDRHGNEKSIGEAFERLYTSAKDDRQAENINFEWFDFHSECRGMKFENVSHLVAKFDDFLESSSETVLENGKITTRQSGVIRTNCMDCLDRTNVAQSAFGQQKLQQALERAGFSIDFVTDPSTNWFNTLWADNGDAISRLYASTAALKGDFTRTRKRNWRGAMNDFGLTISRYYSNMVNDYFSQTVLDVLLGNITWKVFEDFESKMMSADPGISVGSAREAAIDTCTKIVIQDPDKEDIIHAWTMLVPNQENTLRTLPLEEAIVLLTDKAIYCCKMDWSTEKLARYEKVDLRNVSSIKIGVYVTSTFTKAQMDEELNQGLVIHYTAGKGDTIRVNTRSLQNYHVPDPGEGQGVDGGTGILSWVASSVSKSSAAQERMMALKVVPPSDEDVLQRAKTGGSRQIAESVADEVRRAITGSTDHGEQRGSELIEKSDIISVAEAKRRTGYLEQVSHSLRKLVWA
ncbi:hypothetical protein LTR64_003410 [Lithohypha guttulata]|uniref:uncharacterized protein n=1 Tax=Lithohypha guttulata TaxID=1690604 RepID=UPI002DDF0E8F|nr:hypothetical protein LTR51_000372 [Lithohypha guttulata]